MDGVILMKESLLIVAHHLTIGGVQKSLISALNFLDYDKYDVTLYLRKNRTTLLPFVNKHVNVIINEDKNKYYRKPYAVFLQIIIIIFSLLKLVDLKGSFDKKLADIIRRWSMEYEYNSYFKNRLFDKAISYVQGYEVQFVDEYIDAKEKYMFFHTSTDEIHDVHQKALPNFKRIAALHNEQAELIKKWYPEISDRIIIVENFVNRDFITEQSKEYQIPNNSDRIVLCSCGRFSPVKGFDLAIKSAKLLKEKGYNFIWYFVGDGPDREKLYKMISEYKLTDEIVITGMKENPYPYIASCDLYVQPSYEEALGLTIVESLKLGVPVVSTATVGGNKLIVNNKNGLLAEISAESVTEKIIELISDKELRDTIAFYLKSIDYFEEIEKYKDQLINLLEG